MADSGGRKSDPLKVLHLRQSSNIWGPEKGILGVCRVLPAHGFQCEIVIVYRRNEGEPPEHPLIAAARAQGTPITQLDGHAGSLPASIQCIRRRLKAESFSILHCHEYKTDLMGLLAARNIPHSRLARIATVRHTEPGL